jgi:hypothetical protein
MLQRHANIFNSLFLGWDLICLGLAWSAAQSYVLNLATGLARLPSEEGARP